MNISELNYLVLSCLHEQAGRKPALASSLFSVPAPALQRLRQLTDAELRRFCAATRAPVITVNLDALWAATFDLECATTVGWDEIARYRAAVLEGCTLAA